MKKKGWVAGMLLILSSLCVTGQAKNFSGNEWNGLEQAGIKNYEIFEVGREPAHTEVIVYESEEKAIQAAKAYDKEQSGRYRLLNGTWKFFYAQTLEELNTLGDFYKQDVDTTSWADIQVPGNWQTQGFGKPHYTNIPEPWDAAGKDSILQGNTIVNPPPKAPVIYNQAGVYSTQFTVPEEWKDDAVYLSFGGVESAFYVWVDGQAVGYSEDSYTAHDFDITQYLKEGQTHDLKVLVYRFCDGSWLEDQDFIRLSGIFRDVSLYALPKVHIWDYIVDTELDDAYEDGTLRIGVDIRNPLGADTEELMLSAKLLDPNGNFVGEAAILSEAPAQGQVITKQIEITLENPEKWTQETPTLYTLVLALQQQGRTDYLGANIGFREISYRTDSGEPDLIKINGEPVLLRGVNRHETHPVYGRAVTKELMEQDIRIMKEHNINAVRTSHYPNDPYWYYLCDKYGLYVLDEANIECHKVFQEARDRKTEDPIRASFAMFWDKMYPSMLDRVQNMVQRDKNHPSVIIWSMGNESGGEKRTREAAVVFEKIAAWLHTYAPGRPVHYEGVYSEMTSDLGTKDVEVPAYGTDMVAEMYKSAEDMERYAKTGKSMPYIQSEYSHSMGNAGGSLSEYWNVIEQYDVLQGGFIWDFVDQTIYTPVPEILSLKELGPCQFTGRLEGELFDDSQAPNGKGENGGIIYEGSSDYFNQYIKTGQSFTFEVWVKPDEGKNTHFLSKGNNQVALKDSYQGPLEFHIYTGTGWDGLLIEKPVDWVGKWHHIAGIYDKGLLKMFIDGKMAAQTKQTTAAINISDDDVSVGYDSMNKQPYLGAVGGARIYKRALSEEELNDAARTPEDPDILLWIDLSKETQPLPYWNIESERKGQVDGKNIYSGYGGDWGDTPNSGNFCVNGLIDGDRTLQSDIKEVKKVYQNVKLTLVDLEKGIFSARNFYRFQNASDLFILRWEVQKDGENISRGTVEDFDLPPQSETVIEIPYNIPGEMDPISEYFLNIYFEAKQGAIPLIEEGYIVCREQFQLPHDRVYEPVFASSIEGTLLIENEEEHIQIQGRDFSVNLDKKTGLLSSYCYQGTELFSEPPEPNYYRAKTDNDGRTDDQWKLEGQTALTNEKNGEYDVSVVPVEVDGALKAVQLTANLTGGVVQSAIQLSYTIYADGQISVKHVIDAASTPKDMQKVGMQMVLPKEYTRVRWFGKGPFENYRDKCGEAMVGIYQKQVDDMFFAYVKPQENGNRCGVRWIALEGDKTDTGLLFASSKPFETSVMRVKAQELAGQRHYYTITPREEIVLNIDGVQRGIGSASVGQDPAPPYLLASGQHYEYAFRIIPYAVDSQKPEVLSKIGAPILEEPKIEDFYTIAGKAPQLPDYVEVDAGGIRQKCSVEWETVEPQQYEKPGAFTVFGHFAGNGADVQATVYVEEQLLSKPVHSYTYLYERPYLPQTIQLTHHDGGHESALVQWYEPEEYAKEMEYTVLGIVKAGDARLCVDLPVFAKVKAVTREGLKEKAFCYTADRDGADTIGWESDKSGWYEHSTKIDQEVVGGTLELYQEGKAVSYERGIGTHAESILIYNLEDKVGEYSVFCAEAGPDVKTVGSNGMTFKVYVDNGDGYIEMFNSGLLEMGDESVPVIVDISKAKKLKLYVDPNGIESGDRSNWCNARLVKDVEPVSEDTILAGMYQEADVIKGVAANYTGMEIQIQAVFAAYENGRLKQVELQESTLQEKASLEYDFSDPEGQRSLFIWDGLNRMHPLAKTDFVGIKL